MTNLKTNDQLMVKERRKRPNREYCQICWNKLTESQLRLINKFGRKCRKCRFHKLPIIEQEFPIERVLVLINVIKKRASIKNKYKEWKRLVRLHYYVAPSTFKFKFGYRSIIKLKKQCIYELLGVPQEETLEKRDVNNHIVEMRKHIDAFMINNFKSVKMRGNPSDSEIGYYFGICEISVARELGITKKRVIRK